MKKTILGLFAALLLVQFANAGEPVVVKNIKIYGLQRVEKETVVAYAGIKLGDAVSAENLDKALKRLYATELFADVSLKTEEDGDVIIKVVENPVINKRLFDGNNKVKDELLESEVRLKPKATYSRAKVQDDVQRILEVYNKTGRYAAVVNPKVIKRDQNRIDLIYEIDEGPIAAIEKINFVGNTHYTDDELSNEIMSKESRWYRILSSSENYAVEKSNYDKELLRRFYVKHGYADFKVKSAVAELSADKKSFLLTYVLDEGPRYKINNLQINSAINEINVEPMYDEIAISGGSWYNADLVDKSINNLTDELGKQGFAFVDVVPNLDKNAKDGTMDIAFEIKEGDRVFVNRINIKGNTRTEGKVIRREFRLAEGDAFNAAKLKASRKNIEDLNYFSKVDINPVQTADPNKADIDVEVEEKSTGYFNVGIGYSTVNGAVVRTGVVENNFQGKGQQAALDLAVSQRTQEYSASFTEPYFLDKNLSAGIDVFLTDEDYQDEASYDSSSMGGSLRLGWRYTDELFQYVRYTLRNDEIKNVDSSASHYIKDEEGKATASVIGQTLVYDARDNRTNTKEGTYLSFGTDVAGAGGDEKYAKFDLKAYKFWTLADYYTFKIFATGGYIAAFGGEDVRLFNRYYLGGSTMRGFAVAGIGARDKATEDALGGNWMMYSGAEMSFPIGLDELGVKGRTFVDVGMLGKPDNIKLTDVYYDDTPRVAAGFGFQWISPMGQIDIDFAFPVVKEDYDDTEVFRLNFGTRL